MRVPITQIVVITAETCQGDRSDAGLTVMQIIKTILSY